MIIDDLIQTKENRPQLMDYVTTYYEKNKRMKSLSLINVLDMYHLDKKFEEMLNITMFLLDLFNEEITMEKLYAFDFPSSTNDFLNSLFFKIHDYLELSVLNLTNVKNFIDIFIEEIKKEPETEINILKRDFFISLLKKLSNIKIDTHKCLTFYKEYTIEWIPITCSEHHDIIDNMLTNTFEFIYNCPELVYFTSTFFDTCMRILDINNELTSSNYLKYKTAVVISKYFEELITCAKVHVLNNLHQYIKNIAHLCINIYSLENPVTITYQLDLLEFLYPYRWILVNVLEPDKRIKFMSNFLDNYSLVSNIFFENNTTKIYDEELKNLNEFLLFGKLLKDAIHIVNRDKFIMILGKTLKKFVNREKDFDISHLKYIFTFFYLLNENPCFRESLVKETYFICTQDIRSLISIVKDEHVEAIQELCTFIDIERAKHKDDDKDIPEEFLDPIMGTPIKTPVMLPNTSIIMEKEVIIRHLANSEYNPFTREHLTLLELEEFNQREDIYLLVSSFLKQLLERECICK